jgi:hypothetical protein
MDHNWSMSENDKSLEIADQDWPASSYRFERGTVNADVICSPKAIHDPANKNGNQIAKQDRKTLSNLLGNCASSCIS